MRKINEYWVVSLLGSMFLMLSLGASPASTVMRGISPTRGVATVGPTPDPLPPPPVPICPTPRPCGPPGPPVPVP